MAEATPTGGEHIKSNEVVSPEAEARPKDHEAHTKHPEAKPADDIETIIRKVEKEAKSGHEIHVEQKAKHEHPVHINRQLKDEAYRKTLSQARANLSAPEWLFSKIVHQPVIDKASELGAQTIARPISLLTASAIALLGSTVVLYMARHYGFQYNLFLFFALFISGYLLGLIIEAGRFLVRNFHR